MGHATEIPYVFGQTAILDAGEEADLALIISSYWIQFAKSGNPNGVSGNIQWPAYSVAGDSILRLDVNSDGGPHMQTGLRKAACDFQDAHPPPSPGHRIAPYLANP